MSWCPWRELGLAPRASTDEVKTAFKRLAFTHHPDKHVNSPAREQASAEQRFRAIKEAYDTLIDDRRRAAYESAASASPYSRRPGARGGAASSWAGAGAGVDTDWTRRAAGGGGGGGGGFGGSTSTAQPAGASRASRWQWWRRWARQEARTFDRTLHGGLAVLALGGLLLFDAGGDWFWSSRNGGKSFEAAMAAAREQQQRQRQEQQQPLGQEEVRRHDEGGRRPGAWVDSMRGRTIAREGVTAGRRAGAGPGAGAGATTSRGGSAPASATPEEVVARPDNRAGAGEGG